MLGLSALGDWLGLLAASLFAASQFDNTTAQGLAFSSVIVVKLLPSMILGPLAGVFADRWDRRITMAMCDLARFALFASMPLVALWTGVGVGAAGWVVVATFLVEAVAMLWMPAKEAAVPNLLPRARLESANQLALITTYGIAPVLASGIMSLLERFSTPLAGLGPWAKPADIGLYLNALTFLAAAAVVFFAVPEISKRVAQPSADVPKPKGTMFGDFADGWRYVNRNRIVRGLVLGMLGAFGGAGVVIGTGKFYAASLGGGDATFTMLFATVFIGLGVGIAAGPAAVGQLSRRRWFGLSLGLGGVGLFCNAVAPHLWLAVAGTLIVGAGAGMAFLAGITLLGREVDDAVRGRIFAFIATGARVLLMASVAASAALGGFGNARQVDVGLFTVEISFSRVLLLAAAATTVFAGWAAFRQMDDKRGVPVLADLWGSMRGRPLSVKSPTAGGYLVAFEGGEGSGKSTQAVKLAARLRLRGYDVVLTREPGATELGTRIRSLVLDPQSQMSPHPRTEALLYAADRAQHVSQVVRPALQRGAVVITDRYVDSSLAYQGSGRSLPSDEVAWLSNWATAGLKPDVVVLLDVDPAVGLSRATRAGDGDRLEQESLDFHEKVRYKFRDIAAEDPSRYLVVDASGDPEDIAAKIDERVMLSLPELRDEEDDEPPSKAWSAYGADEPAAAPNPPEAPPGVDDPKAVSFQTGGSTP
ncbi:MAG: dTMP kinase [Stackebrandtia sp.]